MPDELQRKHPLVIIGRNGWNCESLVERLNKLKNSKRVFWLDYVSFTDKYALIQSSLAMVFPSLYEGFGLPLLEAFASDIPVITSNITSLPEVAADAAILVDPTPIDDISQAMLNIATDDALQSKMRILGQERVKSFSWRIQQNKQLLFIADVMTYRANIGLLTAASIVRQRDKQKHFKVCLGLGLVLLPAMGLLNSIILISLIG